MERVLVLGAGPAGLGTAAALKRAGVDPLVLERERAVGSSWRRHYERLHLHTFRDVSHLPHRRFGVGVGKYPSRRDVVAYLDDYAREFEIRPRFGQEVRRVERRVGGGWRAHTDDDVIESSALVVATGYNRVPSIPSWPGLDAFGGRVLHSSEYRNGKPFRGKRVLVVGAGNSGAEIALDLFEHGATPSIAIRSPIHVLPRDLLGLIPTPFSGMALSQLPPKLADKLAMPAINSHIGDLRPFGIKRPSYGPITQVVKFGQIPLIDVGTIDLIRAGKLTVRPGLERFDGDEVVFVDGTRTAFDAVVLATGYRAGLESFLEDAERLVDERGYPRFHGEEVPGYRGLYFVGYRNPIVGALNDIRHEALRVAAAISGQR